MLGSIAQDSKRRERFVEVIAGCKKLNGTICVAIKNSENEIYRVTLFPNGTSTCRHQNGSTHEGCASRSHGCYHVQAVRLIASLFTAEGYLEMHEAPRAMQYYYHEDVPTETGDKSYAQALDKAYEKLGATKKTTNHIPQKKECARGTLSSNRGFSLMR